MMPVQQVSAVPSELMNQVSIVPNQIAMVTSSQPAPSMSEATDNHSPQDKGNELDRQAYNLANTKEKTPMCLVNELARYNKIQHQYTLTDEQGPAHKKTFYVKLKLGKEEYDDSGPSIKKAQHACAAIALEKTQYKHPVPKVARRGESGQNFNESITPTVELNALVMKRGEPHSYRNVEMPHGPSGPFQPQPNSMDFRGMCNQRYHFPRYPKVFYVVLKIGPREFCGEGHSRQEARHNAARKALQILRNLPLPEDKAKKEGNPDGKIKKDEVVPLSPQDELKSEISLVHEIALKRNLPVNFEVTRESGPPHMKSFVTKCTVGELSTEGEGNGKKVSKKKAAEEMLERLRNLPPIEPVVTRPKRAPMNNKKKNRNLIKLQKADPTYGVGINPISRLIQIQQAKKEKEPIYSLVSERGVPRRREFVIQVQVGEQTCTGVGPNKKLAKRSAAEAMLQQLGYSRPSPQPSKPAIKSPDAQLMSDKKVKFLDQESHSMAGRAIVPGLLLMSDGNGPSGSGYIGSSGSNVSPHTTAAIAKELLDTGSSPTAESLNYTGSENAGSTSTSADLTALNSSLSAVRPKQQLLYLAEVLGFEVNFTDFPKGPNKTEILTLVSLTTSPPHVSHGSASTKEEAHDRASHVALHALAKVGIEKVPAERSSVKSEVQASGDSGALDTNTGENVAVKNEA